MNAIDLGERRAHEILIVAMGRIQAPSFRCKGEHPLRIFLKTVVQILNVALEIQKRQSKNCTWNDKSIQFSNALGMFYDNGRVRPLRAI